MGIRGNPDIALTRGIRVIQVEAGIPLYPDILVTLLYQGTPVIRVYRVIQG